MKGERLVLHVFPSLDDHFFGAAEYLTLPMGVFFFGLFLRSVFPEDMFRRIWYLLMGISALLCVHAVSGDVLTISNHLIYYQTVLILGGVYTMACILRAVSAKRQGAMVFFCGFLIFFVSVINDILVVRGMLPTPEVGHYGWLVFIFFQSGLLAIRFSQAFKTVEDLSVDLENKVRTRTRDLEIAKDKALSAMEAAEKANQAKSTFLANMSHELRTPLNAVIGFSNLTARDRTLSREQRENLATIIRSGELLLALINDVLEFSKIESGRYALKKDRFDLHHLLRGLEEMFMLRAGQKGLHLEFNPDPGLPRFIAADQNKLRQVLINLLGNAVKFTEKGQISISVSGGVSSDPRNDGRYRLVFDISDTGIGIAEADRQKIFDAFYQAAGQRGSRQGTGLGLPISQQFVRMMGGGIRVESTPDKGARFSFDILVDLAVEDVGQTSSVLPRVIGLKPGGPDIRLLVADDDENNRNLLSRLLEMVGFRVAVVHNGLEALEACKADPPHLVFMDIRMPVMDGYEAIRQLSALENGDRPVIIALTASAFEEDRIRVLRKGADDFMRKPFNETELLAKIAEHLDISYIYEEEDASPPVQEAPSERSVASLPPELKAAFREAAVQADYDRAVALVEDIRQEDDALAGYLLPLIDQYQFDKLEALFTDSPTSGD
ncbi:MAG: ATP-binding protein [Desulfobacterales bacterium]|nr:ATP-binding protein [Desulfobacterales bacterium]